MTGFVNELLGDDRLWDTGLLESTLTVWPLQYELANLAILNRTTDKNVVIRTLNSRPYTGPCGLVPRIQMGRVTAYTGGQDVMPVSFDTGNPAPALEVKYRPSSITEVANTKSMTQMVNTGMNLTRVQQWSRWQGCCRFDSTEMAGWKDAETQKVTLREGEGMCLCFKTDSGPNIFALSIFVKNATGYTYLYNRMVEPLFMAGAPFLVLHNPAGSGDVFQVGRVQVREIGSDEMPKLDFFLICAVDANAPNAQVTWADTSEAIPAVDVKTNCIVQRFGMNNGSILSSPHFRYIMGGEAPYGPGIANGGSVARRGKWSHDMRYSEDATALRLGPGKGIAVVLRNPSALAYSEIVGNFAVESINASAVYPIEDNVREATTYGPTGADYTGDIELPAEADVRLGTSYGSNGTEATGTLAAGGGGGRHIVISGGW